MAYYDHATDNINKFEKVRRHVTRMSGIIDHY